MISKEAVRFGCFFIAFIDGLASGFFLRSREPVGFLLFLWIFVVVFGIMSYSNKAWENLK